MTNLNQDGSINLWKLLRDELRRNTKVAIILTSILASNTITSVFVILLVMMTNYLGGILDPHMRQLISDTNELDALHELVRNLGIGTIFIIYALINFPIGIRLIWEVAQLLLLEDKTSSISQSAQSDTLEDAKNRISDHVHDDVDESAISDEEPQQGGIKDG